MYGMVVVNLCFYPFFYWFHLVAITFFQLTLFYHGFTALVVDNISMRPQNLENPEPAVWQCSGADFTVSIMLTWH